jgi:hypothetical protein
LNGIKFVRIDPCSFSRPCVLLLLSAHLKIGRILGAASRLFRAGSCQTNVTRFVRACSDRLIKRCDSRFVTLKRCIGGYLFKSRELCSLLSIPSDGTPGAPHNLR